MVENYILRNSGTHEEVSDIFQETMIVVYNKIQEDSLDLRADFKGYFYGVARGIWIKSNKNRNQFSQLNEEIVEDSGSDEHPEEYHSETLNKIVARCMTKLNPKCRIAILMSAEGATTEEIARALDYPGTDRVRKHRNECKDKLMELIKSDPEYRDDLV
jgi:RNA polymerase sigma factor (sigma-70 family)